VAGGLGHRRGGILGLYGLLTEHGEAIEYDLLERGMRLDDLGTEALSWRDLLVLVRRWQVMPSTATSEAVHGTRWSVTDQLLALIFDVLNQANWQRQKKRTAPKPKPLPRPWDAAKSTSIGSDPIPISQFDEWWDSPARK